MKKIRTAIVVIGNLCSRRCQLILWNGVASVALWRILVIWFIVMYILLTFSCLNTFVSDLIITSVCNYLRHGYIASLLFKRHWSLTEVEEKCGGKILPLFEHVVKIYCYFVPHYLTSSNTKCAHVSFILILGNSSATSSTAVGFEEIMLLHSEVWFFYCYSFVRYLFTSIQFIYLQCFSSCNYFARAPDGELLLNCLRDISNCE